MDWTQATARIGNGLRERKPPQSNLKENFRRKNPILHIEASLGIVGIPGSGRKTLAYRFANMNLGAIQDGEVPVASFYTANFEGKFSSERSDNPYEQFLLRLTTYIIEPPAELPVHEPPLYSAHWNDFCCLIFAFDVRNQASFHEASLRLASYRQENYCLPACLILVGNKCDRRNDPPPVTVNLEDPEYLNQRPVIEWSAYMEAEHLGALYFECSAKNNTDVTPLLKLIKFCAIDNKYWIQDT
ncbi:unnamed protein product [Larinioides sclopetarius]|uniref:Uncharacterized protein n=1 Tax=Larinioides sclopetarius TaxID=280406 RepID=A0AAV1ZKF4_9ARAC